MEKGYPLEGATYSCMDPYSPRHRTPIMLAYRDPKDPHSVMGSVRYKVAHPGEAQ